MDRCPHSAPFCPRTFRLALTLPDMGPSCWKLNACILCSVRLANPSGVVRRVKHFRLLLVV